MRTSTEIILPKGEEGYKEILTMLKTSKELYNAVLDMQKGQIATGQGMYPARVAYHKVKEEVTKMATSKSALGIISEVNRNLRANPYIPKLPQGRTQPFNIPGDSCKAREDGTVQLPVKLGGVVLHVDYNEMDTNIDKRKVKRATFRLESNGIHILIEYCTTNRQEDGAGKKMGIDIGTARLACGVLGDGSDAIIINGSPMVSIARYYNQRILMLTKMQGTDRFTKQIMRLIHKRDRRVKDYTTKSASLIIQFCKEHGVEDIYTGKLSDYNIGKGITAPEWDNKDKYKVYGLKMFTDELKRRCKKEGIRWHEVNEQNTSITSVIDHERPIPENSRKSRRSSRGLFKSNDGIPIHADLNGAYQILCKVMDVNYTNNFVRSTKVITPE